MIPIYSTLQETYPTVSAVEFTAIQEKYDKMTTFYQAQFAPNSQEELFYVRAPGRVNLIGEHIDYEGYSVLPLAISEEVVCLVGQNNEQTLQIVNVDQTNYPQRGFFTLDTLQCMSEGLNDSEVKKQWYAYVLAGFFSVFNEENAAERFKGMNVVVSGSIPAGCGLSSSSALVVAATISTWFCTSNFNSRDAHEIAALACSGERFVGTMGGGMDQAICCLAQTGYAGFVSFQPSLTLEPVKLPQNAVLVVAQSHTVAKKAQTATTHYNKRVVECMLAAKLLAKKLKLQNWKKICTLRELQECYARSNTTVVADLQELEQLAGELLKEGAYTRAELEEEFETSLKLLFGSSCSPNISKVVEVGTEYELQKRSRHVYNEASRVLQFRGLCKNIYDSEAVNGRDSLLESLGALMNSSHSSCDNLYDCSSKELNALVKKEIDSGALGARLTGAGWGGCTIAIVDEKNLDNFVQNIENITLKIGTRNDYFITKPTKGATIYFPTKH